ncbi:MAG: hypothetical protein RR500_10350, partial [Bacilli bacterium]
MPFIDKNSSNKMNKGSLYNQFIELGRLPMELAKMKSFDEILKSNKDQNQNTFTPSVATFGVTPPNTNLVIQRSLTILSSIEHQNLFKWYQEFSETMKLCQWDSNTALTVLFSIT